MTKSALQLVHLTDPHLFGDAGRTLRGVPTLASLRAVLAAARAEISAAHAILATGDLVHDDPGGYAHIRAELGGFERPVLCVPGNHDIVPVMRAALAAPPFQLGGTWDAAGWRVVLLDSSVPGETSGLLDAAALAWLEQALRQASGRHVLICLHHQPVPMGSRWLDGVGLANGAEFAALVKGFPAVRAVLFGHVHQAFDAEVDGLRMIATPSTCSQFKPRVDDFATDEQPPAWRSLALREDGSIGTELHWVTGWRGDAAA